jgi:hypothetical protein
MKAHAWLVVIGMMVGVVSGETVHFDGVSGAQVTTGDLLDGADHLGLTTNVVEISGLNISAWSGGTNQIVKTLVDSMGINRDQENPEYIRLDNGEMLTLSFDKDIEITKLDFNHFDDGETITISFEEMFDIPLSWSNLSQKSSDYLLTNIVVSAGTKITYFIDNTNSVIGLDGIDLTVIGGAGDLILSLDSSNSMMFVNAEFDGAAITNYVIQSCTNLTSNVWNTVSSEFNVSTNMSFNATNDAQYFRAIAP